MRKLNQSGSMIVPMVLLSLILVLSLGFGVWAFMGVQDYKTNSDVKVTEAVSVAEEALKIKLNAEFAEIEKSPFQSYQGPATYGSLTMAYPKTWSAYIDEKPGSSTILSGYGHPNFVPATNSETAFALRFEIVSTGYDQVMRAFESSVKTGKTKVAAYRAPKVESQLGARIEGDLLQKKQGVMVVLPLRDRTIKIWTEGSEYRADFDAILQTVSYIP